MTDPHPCLFCDADLWGRRVVCPTCTTPKPKPKPTETVKAKAKRKVAERREKKKRDRWLGVMAVRPEHESHATVRARAEAVENLEDVISRGDERDKRRRMGRRINKARYLTKTNRRVVSPWSRCERCQKVRKMCECTR